MSGRWAMPVLRWAPAGLLPVLVVVLAGALALLEPRFTSVNNLLNVLRSGSSLITVAAGQMLVLVVGGFDLSVGAVIALTSAVSATAMSAVSAFGQPAGVAIACGVTAGLGCGLLVGAANAACVALMRLPSFMVTLGTASIASGLALQTTNGVPVYGMPASFVRDFGRALVAGLPISVYQGMLLVGIVWVVQNRTVMGRHMRAGGGNLPAATASGVPARRVLFFAYTASGLLASVAGLLITARIGSGQATTGGELTLQSIAAAVIGGASLRGGVGRIELVCLGALFLVTLTNALNLLGIGSKLQLVCLGLVVVLAVALDQLPRRAHAV